MPTLLKSRIRVSPPVPARFNLIYCRVMTDAASGGLRVFKPVQRRSIAAVEWAVRVMRAQPAKSHCERNPQKCTDIETSTESNGAVPLSSFSAGVPPSTLFLFLFKQTRNRSRYTDADVNNMIMYHNPRGNLLIPAMRTGTALVVLYRRCTRARTKTIRRPASERHSFPRDTR